MKVLKRVIEVVRKKGFGYLLKVLLARIDIKTGFISVLLLPFIIHRVRKLSVEEALEELFSDSLIGFLFKPFQVKEEIKDLLDILMELRPRFILEIGTAQGGTLLLLTKVASDNALIVSIDLPGGPFGGGYPALRKLVYRAWATKGQRIALIRGDSHDFKTLEKVKRVLKDAKLDFLFIDGDHSYEGVKKDFELYAPLVREDGIIALHDIVAGPVECVGGVPEFWKEIKSKLTKDGFVVKEIVKNWNRGGYGIGVIYLKKRFLEPT